MELRSVIWALIVLAVAAFVFVPYLIGRPRFWHAAQEHADLAYQWFQEEDCWVVQHPTEATPDFSRPRSDYVGPFRLQVPAIGNQWVKVYGEADQVEESQDRFLASLEPSRRDG